MNVDQLLETLAELGAEEAADALRTLDIDDPITALVVSVAADVIEREGAAGVLAVKDLIESEIAGEPLDPEALRALPVRLRSDLIAAYERDETAVNTKARAVLAIIVDALSKIGGAVVGALVK